MSLQLDKAAGPECPKCGCAQVAMLDAGRRARYCWAKFECEHCGTEFTLGNRISSLPKPASCTHCGSTSTRQTSTPGRKQFRKCNDCGKSFVDVK